MKIYTKGGDRGETGLVGGGRVAKNHPCIAACGDLDETNCWIGLSTSHATWAEEGLALLREIQHDLFVLGARIAGCLSRRALPELGAERIAALERAIDHYQQQLTPLTAFILPGGGITGAHLHLARAVCRRAERQLVSVRSLPDLVLPLDQELIYLNRLSDLLFVLARVANAREGCPESPWIPAP